MAKRHKESFKTLNDVFDEFTIRNLFVMTSKGFFEEETLSPLSIGKEANVFTASRGSEKVVVKIYRLETADFNKMFDYIKADPRYQYLVKRHREIIFAWCQREYRNLLAARKAQVKAPLPIAFMKNILVMDMIGQSSGEKAAPKLKDAPPSDPQEFLDGILENMRRFYKAGFVHGDLSKFNILNDAQTPVLIDFSQASPLTAPNAKEMLKRDVHNIGEFFKKACLLNIDEGRMLAAIINAKE